MRVGAGINEASGVPCTHLEDHGEEQERGEGKAAGLGKLVVGRRLEGHRGADEETVRERKDKRNDKLLDGAW